MAGVNASAAATITGMRARPSARTGLMPPRSSAGGVLERAAKRLLARVEFRFCGIEARLHEIHAVAKAVAIGDRGDLAIELEAVKPQPAARKRGLDGAAMEFDVLRCGERRAATGFPPAAAVQLGQAID